MTDTMRDHKAIAAAVVQAACETDPADAEHPDTILIRTGDLEAAVRDVLLAKSQEPDEAAVERVARAIYEADADAAGLTGLSWDEVRSTQELHIYYECARAAIAAYKGGSDASTLTGFRAITPTSPAHAAVLEDLARRIDDE